MGIRYGGRAKGTPNKRTAEVAERLRKLNCDPFAGMVALATDPASSRELRGQMYRELAKYLAPQIRAVELTSTEGGPLLVKVVTDFGPAGQGR